MRLLQILIFFMLCSPAVSALAEAPKSGQAPLKKQLVGWVEKARVFPGELLMHAKLVPGTESCSLSAQDIEIVRKGPKKRRWVKFKLADRYGRSKQFEEKLARVVRIKKSNGESQRRYVVQLGICLAGTYQETEVSLVDRSNFEYEMLIGRAFLAGIFAIDPSATHTREPNCKREG